MIALFTLFADDVYGDLGGVAPECLVYLEKYYQVSEYSNERLHYDYSSNSKLLY